MSAPQPITQAYQPGRTVYAILYDMARTQVWSVAGSAWVTFNLADLANYQYALTDAAGIGWYSAPWPAALIGLTLQIVTYDSANPTNPIGATEMGPADTGGIPYVPPASSAAVDIVNKGLSFLGVGSIASMVEDSEAAQKANAIYNGVLMATLRSHYWKFATYVAPLSKLTLPDFDPTNNPGFPVPGWEFMYAYPTQCVMLRRIFSNEFCGTLQGVGFVSYTFSSDFGQFYDQYKDLLFRFKVMMAPTTFAKSIAAHINPANVEYTYLVTDPTMWDQYFADAMSWNLAAQLARPLTGNTSLGTQAQQMFMGFVSEAKRLDAQEDRDTHSRPSSYQRARM